MVRSELVQALSNKLPDLPTRDVELAVNCMIDQMVEGLISGERIEIRGFGSYSLRQRQARNARNPKTGESVPLPARTVVHFKPGKEMRDRIDASKAKYQIKKL